MSLGAFIKKQFIDVIQWNEDSDGTLAWRYPMEDFEIQYGASLTVRESQMAVFVNEGRVADVFGPGRYTLTTQTIPLLTNLKNWDKLFESPFKSDVYFFSTRLQLGRKWGTPQPVTIRDKDFGMVRLRAFGNYAYRVADPKLFHTEISGTRENYTVDDLDGQLRGLILQHISTAIAASGVPFLDLAANQMIFADALTKDLSPALEKLGLKLEGMTVQNVSLPEELQKILDQKIGMGMVGNDMGKFMQYQTAQSIPKFAESAGQGGGIAGDAMGLGAGVALGQVLAQNLQQGLQGGGTAQPQQAAPAAAAPAAMKPEEVMATLEKLGELKSKGILTQEEFDAKKTELLSVAFSEIDLTNPAVPSSTSDSLTQQKSKMAAPPITSNTVLKITSLRRALKRHCWLCLPSAFFVPYASPAALAYWGLPIIRQVPLLLPPMTKTMRATMTMMIILLTPAHRRAH